MQCANPSCSKELLYLREGRLEQVELESACDEQLQPDDGAFTMRPLPSKFFWLCGDCVITYVIKRWTTTGLVLGFRKRDQPDIADTPMKPTQAPLQVCELQPTRQPAYYEIRRPPSPADPRVLFQVRSGGLNGVAPA
jgi:hypothetical protein